MEKKCLDCNDAGHIQRDGNWVRCKCVQELRTTREMLSSGVDVGYVKVEIAHLMRLVNATKCGAILKWVANYQSGDENWTRYGLWLVSTSPEVQRTFMAGMVKEAVKLHRSAYVYYLGELLMGIIDSRKRQIIYDQMMCFDLMGIMIGSGEISPKGVQFVSRFLELACRRRLREGRATIIVSGDKGEQLKKRVGQEMTKLLKERVFERIEC